jgi:arginine decarboxylase
MLPEAPAAHPDKAFAPNSFFNLVDQSFFFPQEGFSLGQDGTLQFHGIPINELVEKYGTPFKLTYLPKIGEQIKNAHTWFADAMKKHNYKGQYFYTYCTKSSHFKYVLNEVLQNIAQLETSSSFDIDLVWRLYKSGKINQKAVLIHNGYKPEHYARKISELINNGFVNTIPVLDNVDELAYYEKHVTVDRPINIGIRIATDEEPHFEFYTSRLGMRFNEAMAFYEDEIKDNKRFNLKMLHFFVDTGIKDTTYYWSELQKGIKAYIKLHRVCPSLSAINIGGGMPIRNSLDHTYDYSYMIEEIVRQIKVACEHEEIPEPDIYTEFGKFTVGESGAMIFSVIGQKQQNDAELWYMIDNSLMTTIPDAWGIGEHFILLPINYWDREYAKINIGGLSCDNSDYYNADVHDNQLFMPVIEKTDEKPLVMGFFHTGAYQDSLSGYGGIKHCLIPSPRHILVDVNVKGEFVDWEANPEQNAESMLKILGY